MNPKYLVIDTTMVEPIRAVVEAGGAMVGNTSMLSWSDIEATALWLGKHGGRSLLDAFELKLINDGMLRLWPVDEDGAPYPGVCRAVEMTHHDYGTHIVWVPSHVCRKCKGEGHHALPGKEVTEEDLCLACCGNGHVDGHEIETDMDGVAIAPAQVG